MREDEGHQQQLEQQEWEELFAKHKRLNEELREMIDEQAK